MLRLNASFSKKVPVEGQDYSSQSYHASVEVEIPEGLTPEQLRERIHDTFALVRASVECELADSGPALAASTPSSTPALPPPSASPEPLASSKQVQYLTRLALDRGLDLRGLGLICEHDFGAASPEALSRRQASELIDRLSQRDHAGSGRRPATRRAA